MSKKEYDFKVLEALKDAGETGLGFNELRAIIRSTSGSEIPTTLASTLKRLLTQELIQRTTPPGKLRQNYRITTNGLRVLNERVQSDEAELRWLADFYGRFEPYKLSDLSGNPVHENFTLGWDKRKNRFEVIQRFKVRKAEIVGQSYRDQLLVGEKELTAFLRDNVREITSSKDLREKVREFFKSYPTPFIKLHPSETLAFGMGTLGFDGMIAFAKSYEQSLPYGPAKISLDNGLFVSVTPSLQIYTSYEVDFIILRLIICKYFLNFELTGEQLHNLSFLSMHLGKIDEKKNTYDLQLTARCKLRDKSGYCKKQSSVCPLGEQFQQNEIRKCELLSTEIRQTYEKLMDEIIPKFYSTTSKIIS